MSKHDTFEKVIVAVRDSLPDERVDTIRDLFDRGEQKVAIELLVDNIFDFNVSCDAVAMENLATLVGLWKLDPHRLKLVEIIQNQSADIRPDQQSDVVGGADVDLISLLTLSTPEDFVLAARQEKFSDVIIVRGLREKFALSFEAALVFLK